MSSNRKLCMAVVALAASLAFGYYDRAAAHCDTLDGPVVQDAREALRTGRVTPVLKWVREKDEKAVRSAFAKALEAKGKKGGAAEQMRFFSKLVQIHRAGEGAPFTGLKPAGTVDPALAEADRALAGGSPEALVKMITDQVATGIEERYRRTAAAYRKKDDSVAAGREFVEAYVEYTHYVERLQQEAAAKGGHGGHGGKKGGAKPKQEDGRGGHGH